MTARPAPSMREISCEGILLAGGARAILLQLAYPPVGRAVVAHSEFATRPLDRLHGTLSYVYAVATGTEQDVTAVRRAVNRAHAPVRGPGYTAFDPQLQLWVAATLYDSAMLVWERVYGALPPRAAERVYQDYAVLGTVLQMPPELWPATRDEFRAYFDGMLSSLEVDDDVRDVRTKLLDGRVLPRPLRPFMPLVDRVTTDLLPPTVREMYHLDWTADDAAHLDRDFRRLARTYKALPSAVRHWPRSYYLKRARQQAPAS